MATSDNIHTYADVEVILRAVLASGQDAVYSLPSVGQARYWIQRANKIRFLRSKQAAKQASVPGFTPKGMYDEMDFKQEMANVRIKCIRQPEGTLTIGGQVVDVSAKPTPLAETVAPELTPADKDLLTGAVDLLRIKTAGEE